MKTQIDIQPKNKNRSTTTKQTNLIETLYDLPVYAKCMYLKKKKKKKNENSQKPTR